MKDVLMFLIGCLTIVVCAFFVTDCEAKHSLRIQMLQNQMLERELEKAKP